MITGVKYKRFDYPKGEMGLNIEEIPSEVNLTFEFEKNEDVLELLFLCESLRNRHCELVELTMPYIPYSREDRQKDDRVMTLKTFCSLINSLGFKRVYMNDPHSDVSMALLNNAIAIGQEDIFPSMIKSEEFFLICPDAGALKKIFKVAERCNPLGIIECSKLRDFKTGEIIGTEIHAYDLDKKDCYIIDDICDGGRTFTEIAKVLKTKNCGKIVLMVTHGFFTKGLGVFEGLIDEIYTMKGRVK